MISEEFKGKRLDIYAFEKNLLVLTGTPNPDYDEKRERALDRLKIAESVAKGECGSVIARPDKQEPFFTAKTSFALNYPYTEEEVANVLCAAVEAWGKYPPYQEKQMDPIQLHYGIKNFKQASYGHRYIPVTWNEDYGIEVVFFMPCKTARSWLGIDSMEFLPSDTWKDIARTIIRFAQEDVDAFKRFHTFKSRLNLTLPKKNAANTADK